jgi:hypothetical protein
MIVANKSDRSPDLCPPLRTFFYNKVFSRQLSALKIEIQIKDKDDYS